ncbi:MbtH family protein [Actinoplanes couchii]|uniref:Protein mbtH n=1 Tax=Actinoplanes couchii TaxID=403638 RepID=A0ABQ3XNP3_9ACTN|nr:MbtH family protein [Actinoplanes couchii]MDR6319671.1 MbtH protein [Actinoplanes couchii]GID60109.1 protein mbtH [Actinoplanes couchii]
MTNPFERTDIDFFVLVNDEGQHSLWPEVIDVPAGWRTVHGPDSRDDCLAYVEKSWWDIRPASLIARMSPAGDA